MPVDLTKPLNLATADADEKAMLAQLQGNILKSHGRPHTANLFLRFDPAHAAAARKYLKSLVTAKLLVPAGEQLKLAAQVRVARRASKKLITPPFVACLLSQGGYQALGLAGSAIPPDPAFRGGMKSRKALLNDPAPTTWDGTYQGAVHAMILVGGDHNGKKPSAGSKQVDAAVAQLTSLLPAAGVQVLGIERGRAYRNANNDGIENFGYVDGRSQPLMLQEDITREEQNSDGTVNWNPAFPLSQVLVRDPAVADPNAFGSYLVFRKLEQNVREFKKAETSLGKALHQLDKSFNPELAGAMMIGRFEDGTPVLLQRGDGMHHPVPNDFDFSGDQAGLKCPFHAHIRKTNPRGDTTRMLGESAASERAHLMARRGITYGDRVQDDEMEFTDKPSRGVGLLFMSYQSNLQNQFEFIQKVWANAEGFVAPGTGVDPVIGQGGTVKHKSRSRWGAPNAKIIERRFADFVTLKGGEYFFAPSLPFFSAL